MSRVLLFTAFLLLISGPASSNDCAQLLAKISKKRLMYASGRFPRESGILMPVSSLPGDGGIGEIGEASKEFIDLLAEMKQRLWQVLPTGPTSYGNSPYQAVSSFAGNPLLISMDDLIKRGYLMADDVSSLKKLPQDVVDYGELIPKKSEALALAARRFESTASDVEKNLLAQFTKENEQWLDDYALFVALKNSFDGAPWYQWPKKYKTRRASALKLARENLKQDIETIKIEQFFYDRQWKELRAYAKKKNVELVGDIPIFVAHDSSDVWANQGLFHLHGNGSLKYMAGVPPDAFSETGQLWGNPLYNWKALQSENYSWWIDRLMRNLDQFDRIRIDHFRGFEAAWQIPGKATDATGGKWVKGPGEEFFEVAREAYHKKYGQELPIILEDLGIITDEVASLREKTGLPGMNIVQFFDNPAYHPENFIENSVAYTSTHDNQTMIGFIKRVFDQDEAMAKSLKEYTGATTPEEISQGLIEKMMDSRANTAIITMQDLLLLGDEARINTPGNPMGNWGWRMSAKDLKQDFVDWFAKVTQESGR